MREELSYRERFGLTLAHRDIDRVPMDLDSTDLTGIDGGPRRLADALGIRPCASDAETDEAVLQALDTDIRGVGGILEPNLPPTCVHGTGQARGKPAVRRVSETDVVNAWGITSRWNGHHYEMVGHPLTGATIGELEKFPWPDPKAIDGRRIRELGERARYLYEKTPYVVCGRHPVFGVMELGCWLCGYDDFLLRMAAEPEFVLRLFEIISEYQHRVDEMYFGAVGRYIHFTTAGDDFGTQTGPFVSPSKFRELVVPYLARRIRHISEFTDAAFFQHSCGAIRPLIPDLIAAGVTILNPIQPRAAGMEPAVLKREFGDRLTFYGGVDTQQLLPNGTADEVFAATRELIGVLAQAGGYVLSAAHTLQPDVPVENIIAMYRAGRLHRS